VLLADVAEKQGRGTENARGRSLDEARKRLADLVWSFGEKTPPSEELLKTASQLPQVGGNT
jgi:hypothetical protein